MRAWRLGEKVGISLGMFSLLEKFSNYGLDSLWILSHNIVKEFKE
jgi:hypothetical protein